MKRVGIWMDKEKAHLVTFTNGKDRFKTVFSALEFYHPKGGSRSKTRWGPQEAIRERTYLEREKNQLKAYFAKIAYEIKKADAVAIFGPGDTGSKFEKELEENNQGLHKKIRGVTKVDAMTDNQFRALVREFYKIERD